MANVLGLVSYNVFPPQMGGQKAVVTFYEELKKHHRIHLALSKDNGRVSDDFSAETFLYNNKKNLANLLYLPRLIKTVKQKGIDCIVAEHSYPGWLAYLLKKFTGRPFIIHSHNIEAARFRRMGRKGWKLYQRYEKWIHQKADYNFFISEEDLQTAVRTYNVEANKCSVLRYGVKPFVAVPQAKEKLRELYGIKKGHIFYFNGTLDYTPNRLAVQALVQSLVHALSAQELHFVVLISGLRLQPSLQQAISEMKAARYLGFVDDLPLHYQGADLFINPVINDTGVKTKVAEAIGNNCTVVSTVSGAAGIPATLCGDKLQLAPDGDWQAFAQKIKTVLQAPPSDTPPKFFEAFSLEAVAKKAAAVIDKICKAHEQTVV